MSQQPLNFERGWKGTLMAVDGPRQKNCDAERNVVVVCSTKSMIFPYLKLCLIT